ncbi:very long chain fatty acid elongase AAEL008004-like isoform X1 [Bacillus rossius redtenbacheri]|uniref:very long chain fatty acid elongase AAEL008004-like isoform X1 n=1 Tax=Bacillus rossius redtenbacheri TaxID=93214 RepID=UPI002FDDC1A1
MGLLGELHEALSRAGDARVRDWPLLGSPLPLLALLAGYLWVVKVAAPRLMRGRAPCRLRAPVAAYNLLQVLANACLFHGLLTNGWTKNFNLGCYMPDYSDNPEALKMATLVWYELCLKVVDLIETVLFVLRGKEKQASFLHVYHHVATVLIVYTGAKFVPGGYATFAMLVNNLVHVLMYSYYLVTVCGPRARGALARVKRYLTLLQMVQFVLVAVHYVNVMVRPDCPAPRFIHYMFLPYIGLMFYLFYDFYRSAYRPGKDKL